MPHWSKAFFLFEANKKDVSGLKLINITKTVQDLKLIENIIRLFNMAILSKVIFQTWSYYELCCIIDP